jgi:hypothetical protein
LPATVSVAFLELGCSLFRAKSQPDHLAPFRELLSVYPTIVVAVNLLEFVP